jgi:hypothetical protein
VALGVAAARALATAAATSAAAPFFADTTCMSVKRKDAARAAPTINVMMGVAIFMTRGTQHSPVRVQRFRRI